MLDQLRHDIKTRLDELLADADKLRQALTALGSRENPPAPAAPSRTRARTGTRARRPARSTGSARTAVRRPPRSRPDAGADAVTPSPPDAESAVAKAAVAPKRPATRRTPGTTKNAILTALADGSAMTAADIAAGTGLPRPTVSTTLSRLAKSGEVTKAARGYQVTASATSPPAASGAAVRAEDDASTT